MWLSVRKKFLDRYKNKFLDRYIKLLISNDIHVYYGPFVTMKWSEFERERDRRQPAKTEAISCEDNTLTTAD